MTFQHDPEILKAALLSDRVLSDGRVRRYNTSAVHKRRMRDVLLEVHGSFCWLCNREIVDEEPTLDHVVPRSKGGRNAIANMRLAHSHCNMKRGNRAVPELLLTKAMRLSPGSKPLVETQSGSIAQQRDPDQRQNPTITSL